MTSRSQPPEEINSWASLDLVFGFLFIMIIAFFFAIIRPGYDLPNTSGFIADEIVERIKRTYPDQDVGSTPIWAVGRQGLLRTTSLFAFDGNVVSGICSEPIRKEALFDGPMGMPTSDPVYGEEAKNLAVMHDMAKTTDHLVFESLPACLVRAETNGDLVYVSPARFLDDLLPVASEVILDFVPENRGGRSQYPSGYTDSRLLCERDEGRKCPGFISMVLVEGHGDREGGATTNDVVATARANEIQERFASYAALQQTRMLLDGEMNEDALLKDGSLSQLFVGASFGCRRPVQNVIGENEVWTDPKCPVTGDASNRGLEALNRRVDLRIIVPVG